MTKEPMKASVILISDDGIISLFLAEKLSTKVKEVFSFSFFRRAYQRTNSIPDDLVAAQKQLASILGCIATSHNESRKKGRPVNYKFSCSTAYAPPTKRKFQLARDDRFHSGVVINRVEQIFLKHPQILIIGIFVEFFYFFGLRAVSNEMVRCVHLLVHHPLFR
ncbi:hypothetical protein WUBG_00490 [Wuchereria bancrofti]|uniref:Uncharacterized protein n=1 Tax=Wuchereria bancrofti TaxID=6293 RepID=J9BM56_WUCBA|nr:hypothetical protein WUBG_00490 [Wuchereria bancrofti]VDM06809.1 unnamed protein product [Wuchereria bancrofti]